MIEIIQKEDPKLREKAKEVPVEEIRSEKVLKIIRDMKEALESQPDGVAIAAPQIGESLRIFVMSKRVFDIIGTKPKEGKAFEDSIFINPKITKISKEKEESEEGCLSVRYLYGKVLRSKKATIEAYDEKGKKFISGGTGIVAQIFQHECDHLDGILFVDKAKDLQEIPPEKELTKKTYSMKFVFFGSSEFSIYVLNELEARGVVPPLIVTTPDKPKGRKLIITPSVVKVWAREKGIEVIDPKSLKVPEEALVKKLEGEEVDFFLVASYGKIIPASIFNIPKFKTLNIHPSLLPKYRGASPIISQILNDEKDIGTSIMLVDEGLDTGPIVAQKRITPPLTPPQKGGEESENPSLWGGQGEVLSTPELEKIMAKESVELFMTIIDKWLVGEIEAKPQDDTLATLCGKIEKEDGLLDLNDSVRKNLLKIKAFSHWPRAYYFHNGKRIIVTDAKIETRLNPSERGRADDKVGQDSELKIISVIPEGKKEMPYENFLRGNK